MIYNHTARQVNDIVQKRINALKIGQKMQDLPEDLWHDSFKFYVKHDKTRKGGPNMRLIRLDPDACSLTVTGFIFNKFVHPYENRYITVREAARLQGFPDEVEFMGTLTSTQQQVGNAVPVPLAKAIFDQICEYESNLSSESLLGFSLFCGAGGMDIGAHNSGYNSTQIETKLAIDCWEDACKTLDGYLGKKIAVIKEDIRNITNPLEYWHKQTHLTEKPTIVFGGPPCQAFSQAGKQKGIDDPRGNLIFEFLRFIKDIHPKYFVMENVSNLKSIQKGVLIKKIIDDMKSMGYNVDFGVLCAADYGAPQKRRRAIFIGTDKNIGKVLLPFATHCEESNLLGLKPYVTVKEAFEGLPIIKKAT